MENHGTILVINMDEKSIQRILSIFKFFLRKNKFMEGMMVWKHREKGFFLISFDHPPDFKTFKLALGFIKNIRSNQKQADVLGFWQMSHGEEGVPEEFLGKPVMFYFQKEDSNENILAVSNDQITYQLNIREAGRYSRYDQSARDYMQIHLPVDEFLPVVFGFGGLLSDPGKLKRYAGMGCLAIAIFFVLIAVLILFFG